MTANASPRLPKKVGPYEVKDVIGRGAMGEVLLAVHEHLDRSVALKRKLPGAAGLADKESIERFLREAKVLARLEHHSIVQIHDLFSYRDNLYMVLEYVDGFNVLKLLEGGPLAPDVAAIIGLRIAEALEYAHFHRIIHRDIKASNVMVSKDGNVKLMDFGIARDQDLTEVLTQTGVVVGTPVFLAPELFAGETADEKSDIYAAGALLYQCISGRRIFDHATAESIYPLILAGKYVPLQKITAEVPRALIRIVDRCLARKRERRFQTATELRRELERFLNTHYALANHAARVVGYLKAKGKITDEESGTYIDAQDLIVSEEPALAPRKTWRWVAVALVAAAGGAWFVLRELGVNLP